MMLFVTGNFPVSRIPRPFEVGVCMPIDIEQEDKS